MGSRKKKSIGIIGGGIGGAAAALALHRIGFDVSIYDRAERLREAGAGMMLWPNATRVLRGLGVLEKVLTKCLGSGLPVGAALRRYESLRFRRTKHIQQRSLLMGYIGQWQAPLFVNGRNIVTRMLPARLIERNLRRVYSYVA
jgi:2-polyprenyl-6-methoxyphenol hydroxylase-like FAD-dependent oxidoreductase